MSKTGALPASSVTNGLIRIIRYHPLSMDEQFPFPDGNFVDDKHQWLRVKQIHGCYLACFDINLLQSSTYYPCLEDFQKVSGKYSDTSQKASL